MNKVHHLWKFTAQFTSHYLYFYNQIDHLWKYVFSSDLMWHDLFSTSGNSYSHVKMANHTFRYVKIRISYIKKMCLCDKSHSPLKMSMSYVMWLSTYRLKFEIKCENTKFTCETAIFPIHEKAISQVAILICEKIHFTRANFTCDITVFSCWKFQCIWK